MKSEKRKFSGGKPARHLREVMRADVTLIGCGPLVYEAIKAAEELAKEGISAEVINNHTIKPMDKETILKSVKKTGCVVSDRRTSGSRRNGFGRQRNFISKLSRADGNHRRQRPIRRIR